MKERPTLIRKELSRNDSGETGGHQAGILIPRDESILSFFPALAVEVKNPRHTLTFVDESGERWQFQFIYYNNKRFGGTRNEYRLTCMTPFIRANNLKAGDTITLRRDGAIYSICFTRRNAPQDDDGPLKLGSGWRIVYIK